jgi:hypothetical protein
VVVCRAAKEKKAADKDLADLKSCVEKEKEALLQRLTAAEAAVETAKVDVAKAEGELRDYKVHTSVLALCP